MSSAIAIGAVTRGLLRVIDGDGVVGRSLSMADAVTAGADEANLVNVLLFQASVNPSWRNQDLPDVASRGEVRRPLLPLNLHYLVTACGESQPLAHESLGRAMLRLHDHCEFSIERSASNRPPTQPLRITPLPMTIDEISKLWSILQAAYRPSVAYEVSVLLVESELSVPVPLPVLRRGPQGRGWDATTQGPPHIESVRVASDYQAGARLGERVTLVGRNLRRGHARAIELKHVASGWAKEIELLPADIREDEISFQLPNDPSWPAGQYLAAVQFSREGDGSADDASDDDSGFRSSAVAVAVVPEIVVPPGGLTAVVVGEHRELTIPVKSTLVAGQQGEVLIGNRHLARFRVARVEAGQAPPSGVMAAGAQDVVVAFAKTVTVAKDGEFARLGLDGVYSTVHKPGEPQLGFDARLKVKGVPYDKP